MSMSTITTLAQQPIGLYIALGVAAVVLIWFIATYNTFVRLRQHVKESWSDVDTELKRRYDLIPNLVETVKGYATHERQVLEQVIEARNQAAAPHESPGEQAREERKLSGAVRQLFAVAEAYPDLKANTNYLHLQKELANTEDRIQAARRFYNANVRDLNTRLQVVPSNVVGKMFSFQKAEFFELEDAERAVPEVSV